MLILNIENQESSHYTVTINNVITNYLLF